MSLDSDQTNKLRILHLSDVHLGAKVSFLNDKAVAYRRQLVQTFESIQDVVEKNKIQLVLIAGDLFDSPFPSRTNIEIVKALFKKLTDRGVYVAVIPGNHDYMAPGSVFANGQLAIGSQKLIVFSDPKNSKIVIDELGVVLYAKPNQLQKSKASPLPNKQGDSNVFGGAQLPSANGPLAPAKSTISENNGFSQQGKSPESEDYTKDYFQIALAHGSVEVKGRLADNYPISAEKIANSGFDYIALGDWHSTYDASAGIVKAYYPGALEPLAIDQVNSGSAIIVELSSAKGSIKHHVEPNIVRIGNLASVSIDIELEKTDNVISAIDGKIEEFCKQNKTQPEKLLVNVRLIGPREAGKYLNTGELTEYFYSKVFFIKINDQTKLKLDKNLIEQYPEYTLIGKFIKYIQENKQIDGELKGRALDEGLRLLTKD